MMKKDDIKDNVDNMLIQVVKYIQATELSEDEEFQIKLESAMSLLVSALDIPDDPAHHIDDLLKQTSHMLTVITITMTDLIHNIVKGDIQEDRMI